MSAYDRNGNFLGYVAVAPTTNRYYTLTQDASTALAIRYQKTSGLINIDQVYIIHLWLSAVDAYSTTAHHGRCVPRVRHGGLRRFQQQRPRHRLFELPCPHRSRAEYVNIQRMQLLVLCFPASPGSPPQSGGNSYLATKYEESAIWTYEPATAVFTPHWVNTDGSTPETTIVLQASNNYLFATGDVSAMQGDFGASTPLVSTCHALAVLAVNKSLGPFPHINVPSRSAFGSLIIYLFLDSFTTRPLYLAHYRAANLLSLLHPRDVKCWQGILYSRSLHVYTTSPYARQSISTLVYLTPHHTQAASHGAAHPSSSRRPRSPPPQPCASSPSHSCPTRSAHTG
jgi:hypothetical protein